MQTKWRGQSLVQGKGYTMRIKDENGFTLIEIIVVIVIIAIMATIAAPNFLTWLPNMRLKEAARDLYSSMQKAKLEAAKQNSCAGMSFIPVVYPATGGRYVVFMDDGNGSGIACNGTQDGAEAELLSQDIKNDVSLISASIGSASSFCFTSTSVICGSQSGNIQLRNNKSRWYKITVAASGGVRFEMSGDGTNWSY